MAKKKSWIALIVIDVLIKIVSFFPGVVEQYYSTGAYPYISGSLRLLFGWAPFSIGDVFYAAVIIYLIAKFISFFKKVFKRAVDKKCIFLVLKQVAFITLAIYAVFNLLWGLNYNRRGIAYQLNLNVRPYSAEELQHVLQIIVGRLNTIDSMARLHRDELKTKHILFSKSIDAYRKLSADNAIFTYTSPSVKPSVFSYAGDYLGFTGYYNPFSGEAQVNTTVPVFVQPFTTCHEIGHQLGFAKENEANFAGYLSAKASGDPAFRYSVYFDLYMYAAKQLYLLDSTKLVPLRESLRPSIRKDYRDLRAFYRKYENPFEPVINRLYGNYLKANQQPQGMMSYDEVIAWLIAYYKKYGKEAV
ncbi:MAG: DUF3810 domain-containing protein [Bacteroidetes bacterium]|nr:DUF3810 domain-containing protein [Bacteroidota bacterium]